MGADRNQISPIFLSLPCYWFHLQLILNCLQYSGPYHWSSLLVTENCFPFLFYFQTNPFRHRWGVSWVCRIPSVVTDWHSPSNTHRVWCFPLCFKYLHETSGWGCQGGGAVGSPCVALPLFTIWSYGGLCHTFVQSFSKATAIHTSGGSSGFPRPVTRCVKEDLFLCWSWRPILSMDFIGWSWIVR